LELAVFKKSLLSGRSIEEFGEESRMSNNLPSESLLLTKGFTPARHLSQIVILLGEEGLESSPRSVKASESVISFGRSLELKR
jgi:hypothetical protein